MNRTRGAHDTKLTRDFSRTLVEIFEQKGLLFVSQEKVGTLGKNAYIKTLPNETNDVYSVKYLAQEQFNYLNFLVL